MLFYLSLNFECSSFHLTITRNNCGFGINCFTSIDPANLAFITDNASVFDILHGALIDHKHVYVWIKSYYDAKDGHAAWTAFFSKYHSTAALHMIAILADNVLNNINEILGFTIVLLCYY